MSEGVRDLWGQQPKVVAGSVLLADHAGRGASERRGVNENREAGGDTLCGPPVARLAGRFQARFLVRFLGRVTPRLAPLLLLPLLLCPLGGAAADDLLERLTAPLGAAVDPGQGADLGPNLDDALDGALDGDLDLGGDSGGAKTNALVTFRQANIAGLWHFHVWVHGSYPVWVACGAVKVKPAGAIVKGSKCLIYDADSGKFYSGAVGGGALKLSSSGKVSGKLIVGTGQLLVADGWMDKKKSFFQTVGVFGGYSLAVEMSALKR